MWLSSTLLMMAQEKKMGFDYWSTGMKALLQIRFTNLMGMPPRGGSKNEEIP